MNLNFQAVRRTVTSLVHRVDMARLNYGFNFLFFSLSALVGSVSSFLLSSAFIWALVRISQNRINLIQNTTLTVLACIFALFPLSELLSAIVNQRGFSGLVYTAGAMLWLSVLPILSRLAVNSPSSILTSTGQGAAIGAITSFIFSLIQIYLLHIDRAEAGFGNPSILAAFALILCCVCCTSLPVIEVRWRPLLVAGVFCGLGSIALAGTRAVWLATPIALLIAAWPMIKSRPQVIFGPKTIVMVFLAGVATPFGFNIIYSRLKETVESFRHVDVLTSDASISWRLFFWRGGWEQAKQSLTFGYGPDSTQEMIAALGKDQPYAYTHYHNFLMTGLIRGGLLELIAMFAIFAAIIWIGVQKSNNALETAGRFMILSTLAAATLPAMAGVLFTHDITNSVFLYTTIIGLSIIYGKKTQ